MPSQYNAHAHCFIMQHVPEEFFFCFGSLGKILRISKLKNKHSLNRMFAWLLTRSWVIAIFSIFSDKRAGDLRRLKGLLKYEDELAQAGMIKTLSDIYDGDFGFILLTMDMDEMGAGDAVAPFLQQLEELKKEKESGKYADKIFPFIFAHPRRAGVSDLVKKYITNPLAPFSGIKFILLLVIIHFIKICGVCLNLLSVKIFRCLHIALMGWFILGKNFNMIQSMPIIPLQINPH